jgi:hypothetical protein
MKENDEPPVFGASSFIFLTPRASTRQETLLDYILELRVVWSDGLKIASARVWDQREIREREEGTQRF